MRTNSFFLLATLLSVLVSGCTNRTTSTTNNTGGTTHPEHEHDHGDELFWQREGVEEAGYVISLGHHGIDIFAGHKVEPAVSITQDDQPVADAQVFCTLLDDEGNEVIADEVGTVFEPTTAEEPAHYAQGELNVPGGLARVVIRYRIRLPGISEDLSYDIPIALGKH